MSPLALLLLTFTAQNALAFNTISEQMGSSSASGGGGLYLMAVWAVTFIGIPIVVFAYLADFLTELFPKLSENQIWILAIGIQGAFTYFNADWLFPLADQIGGFLSLAFIVGGVWWFFKSK